MVVNEERSVQYIGSVQGNKTQTIGALIDYGIVMFISPIENNKEVSVAISTPGNRTGIQGVNEKKKKKKAASKKVAKKILK